MENRQERTIKAFENVLGYFELRPITPEPPLLVAMKKSLRVCIETVQKLHSTQIGAMIIPGGKVEHRRRQLRRAHLIPLVRTMKPLMKFAPGEARLFTVPHAREDALTVALAAIEIAKILKPQRKLMAAAGYPPTYLTELQHEARELALAAKQVSAARQRRAAATRDIARELKKGMQTVDVMEGIVSRHVGHDKGALDFWKRRRRVGARVGRPPQRRTPRAPAAAPPSLQEVATADSSLPSPA